MKNYQKPELEYVVLTTAEEIASGDNADIVEGEMDVVSNPFARLIIDG